MKRERQESTGEIDKKLPTPFDNIPDDTIKHILTFLDECDWINSLALICTKINSFIFSMDVGSNSILSQLVNDKQMEFMKKYINTDQPKIDVLYFKKKVRSNLIRIANIKAFGLGYPNIIRECGARSSLSKKMHDEITKDSDKSIINFAKNIVLYGNVNGIIYLMEIMLQYQKKNPNSIVYKKFYFLCLSFSCDLNKLKIFKYLTSEFYLNNSKLRHGLSVYFSYCSMVSNYEEFNLTLYNGWYIFIHCMNDQYKDMINYVDEVLKIISGDHDDSIIGLNIISITKSILASCGKLVLLPDVCNTPNCSMSSTIFGTDPKMIKIIDTERERKKHIHVVNRIKSKISVIDFIQEI